VVWSHFLDPHKNPGLGWSHLWDPPKNPIVGWSHLWSSGRPGPGTGTVPGDLTCGKFGCSDFVQVMKKFKNWTVQIMFKSCSNPVVPILFKFSSKLFQIHLCSRTVHEQFKTGSTVGEKIQIYLDFF
jgi:hypothetical protein